MGGDVLMGAASRAKGNRGECEARALLLSRGYEIIETARGRSVEDIIAERGGRRVSVEVKNTAALTIGAFRKQAKEQARKRKCAWMLMWRIEGYPGTFYVEGAGIAPSVWRAEVAL